MSDVAIRWLGMITLFTLCLHVTTSQSQDVPKPHGFPSQPLQIIVPRGPGGGSDQVSTQMAAALQHVLGVQVKVTHRPQHDGIEAIEHYMSLPPTGDTILQHVDDIASLYARHDIQVDPTQDLTPLAIAQITFSQLYVRNLESRFSDWPSFVSYVKAHPHEIRVALVGHEGSMERFILDVLAHTLNLDVIQVSFNRPAARYTSLFREEADALIEQPGDVRPFLKWKLIKPILTLLPEGHAEWPEAAALNDIATDFEALYRFRAFFVHTATAPERRRYLESAFKRAFLSDTFQAFNREKYMHLVESYRNTDDARSLIKNLIKTYQMHDSAP